MKSYNRRIIFFGIMALVSLCLFVSALAKAGDLNAPFHGVGNLCGPSMVSDKTIGCWDGSVDSANGLLDSTENLVKQSRAVGTSPWVEAGNSVVTDDCAYGPDGTYTADKVYVEGTGNGIYQLSVDVGNVGDEYSPSFYIKRISKTGTIVFGNAHSLTTGQWGIDLSKLGDGWERVSRNHYAVSVTTEMVGHTSGNAGPYFYMSSGSAEFYLTDVQIESQRGLYHVGPIIHTEAVAKTRLDMTASGAPGFVSSDTQDSDGNRLRAMSLNGVNQWQSHANDTVMHIWDGDFSITYEIAGTTIDDYIFSQGSASGGVHCSVRVTGNQCVFRKSGGSVVVNGPVSDPTDGLYHVVQVVRKSNYATIYTDGVPGASVDVSGYGIDTVDDLTFGAYSPAGGYEWPGELLYTRIDRAALSADELSRQSDILMGMASSVGRYNEAIWDVERTTVASQEFSNKSMSDAAVDRARVGGDGGGLLVERQSTNTCKYSQEFDQWTSKFRCSVIANTSDVLAPDGTQTVDIIHEDATAADNHFIRELSIPVVVGEDYSYSVYAKAGNRNWINIKSHNTGIASFGVFVDLSNGSIGTLLSGNASVTPYPNGFYRITITGTAIGTGDTYAIIYVAEADNDITFDGLDQDSLYVWQAQVEEGLYASSPIETGATAVTRTADNVSLDLHPTGKHPVLPPTISGPITVEFEAKCLFDAAATVDATKTLLSISGNTGTADVDTNNFYIQVASDGKLSANLYDSADTIHSLTTAADPVDFSEWFKVKAYMDLSDGTQNDLWVNGSNTSITKVGNTGSATWSTLFNELRIGQDYASNVTSDCRIRNLRISPKQF